MKRVRTTAAKPEKIATQVKTRLLRPVASRSCTLLDPTFTRYNRPQAVFKELRLAPRLRRFVAQPHCELTQNPLGFRLDDVPAVPPQHDMHPAMGLGHTALANVTGLLVQAGLRRLGRAFYSSSMSQRQRKDSRCESRYSILDKTRPRIVF